MKNYTKFFLLCFFLSFIFNPFYVKSQYTLTRNDSVQIIKPAEELITQFQYVLNAISNFSVESDIVQNIQSSYDSTSGPKQIFKNEDIRIDDDLKKANYLTGIKKNIDKPISQYLFDYRSLFQSAKENISLFSNIVFDTMYFANSDLYATVYFNSSFNTNENENWPVTKRKAEIICKKKPDDTWDLKLYQISFNWFDRENFIATTNKEIKKKKFKPGLISDSLKIYFCNYKKKPGIPSMPESEMNTYNQELIFADLYYSNSYFGKALEKYLMLSPIFKQNDYLEKRIANCTILKYNVEKKQEANFDSQWKTYQNYLLREELSSAKQILDTIMKMVPDNSAILSQYKELSNKIDVSKELQNYLNTNEKLFRELIDNKLNSADSSNEYLYYLRGCYFERRNQYDFALTDLNKAISMVPLFIGALKERVKVFLNLKKPEKAMVDLDRLLEEEPNNDTLFNWLGESHRLAKNCNKAINYYSKAIELNENNPEYYYNRGLCKLLNENSQNALGDFKLAILNRSKNMDAFYQLYKIYFDLEKYDSSFYYLQGAKQLGIPADYRTDLDTQAEKYFKNGMDQLTLNSFSQALTTFRISANFNYEKHLSWYNYAKLDIDLNNNYSSAVSSLDSALKYNPNNSQYLLLRAKAKYFTGQYNSAIDDYGSVINLSGSKLNEKIIAYEGKADALRSVSKDFVAENDYKAALELSEKNTSVLFKLARLYTDNNKAPEAIKIYERILGFFEVDSAFFKKGKCFQVMGDYKSALKEFKYTLIKNKNYFFANYESGICHKKNEDYGDAIKSFSNEILLQPNHVPSFAEKANCEFKTEQYKLAYSTFRSITLMEKEFIKKDPDLCKVYAYCCLFENTNMTEANEYIEAGLKLYPNEKYFVFLQAEYAYLNKQEEIAKTYFKQAFDAKAVSEEQLKKDEIFNKIKKENKEIKALVKSAFN